MIVRLASGLPQSAKTDARAKTTEPEGGDLSALLDRSCQGQARPPRAFPASPEELAAHRAFLSELKDPIWLKLWGQSEEAQG